MGKIAKVVGIGMLVAGLKGSYHLGKTADEDKRYDLTRRENIAYLVDRTSNEYARLDETRPLRDQPAFCPPPPPLLPPEQKSTLDEYFDAAASYLRRVLE
ncbi:hypothetical protein HY488_03405 [Candidatus Woesearchaeota archaeon]|nr:hypothetical protein [Candidatus Woesearchaeota archaeon]